ncbi:MAG: DUF362 domain-containing protein [Phycisphaerae bacterium]|nr:DUF362 domain-containing protein [Phycisphaerae bacterium]
MNKTSLILTRCTDYESGKIANAIHLHFKLLGGIDKFISRGDKVLIKPNFIAPRRQKYATQTDPSIIIELAKILKDYGAKPFVADSPAWGNVFECVKALKIEDELKQLNIPVRQLNKPVLCNIGNTKRVRISSVALDADKIINLPKFKSHQQMVATFAVKNMFGCVAGKQKPYWHFAKGGDEFEFCKFLIDIYRFMNPVLNIIDAVVAMDGAGPIRGRARPLGWIISSADPIACERICCELVGINHEELPMLKAAKKINFATSSLDDIEVSGDDYHNNICTDFEPAVLIPIRFTFLRVCKSIAKQLLRLFHTKKNQQN